MLELRKKYTVVLATFIYFILSYHVVLFSFCKRKIKNVKMISTFFRKFERQREKNEMVAQLL